MPHVRVDLHKVHQSRLPEYSNAILAGMVRGLEMPEYDLFQTFRTHETGELYYTKTFPNVDRDEIIFIELVGQVGYTNEQKQAGMSAIADEMEAIGVKRDNMMFVFLEVHGSAWYPLASRG